MDSSSKKRGVRPWDREVVDQPPLPGADRTHNEVNTSRDASPKRDTMKAPRVVPGNPQDNEATRIAPPPETSACPSTMGPLRETLLQLKIVSESDWNRAAAEIPEPKTDLAVLDRLTKIRASWVLDPNQYEPAITRFQVDEILSGNASKLRFQNHVLLDRIGAGGMGEVFKARNVNLSRIEAIKTIRPDQIAGTEGSSARQRFEREAHILATLNHQNITTIYYSGYEKDMAYIAMEYVSGTDMETEVRNAKSRGELIPVWWAVQRIIAVAEALEHAHQHEVIHRDIKPGNIMNTGSGLKVLDMGIARLAHPDSEKGAALQTLTQGQTGIGTPQYMPPEQWADARNVEPSSDIYSLGCTLYFILAGDTPFHADTLHRWMFEHVHTVPTPVSKLRSDVPKELDRVISKMLAKLPEQRYQTAAEVIEALRPFAEQTQTKAPRRRDHVASPVLAGAAAFVVVTLIAVATFAVFGKRSLSNLERAKQLVEASPTSPEAHLQLAQAYASEDQASEAIDSFAAVLALDADNGDALLGRGMLHLRQGNADDALADLRAALAVASGERRQEVRDALRDAYSLKAKQLTDDPARLLALYREAAADKLVGDDLASLASTAFLKQAERLLADRQWEQAIQSCEDLLQSAAEDLRSQSAARLIRGKALASLGKDQPAIDDLKFAVDQCPADAKSQRSLEIAEFCYAQAKLNFNREMQNRLAALAWLDAALQLEPKMFLALKMRGELHLRANDNAKALADVNQAVALREDSPLYAFRGQLHLNEGRIDEAVEDFRLSVKLAGDPSEVQRLAAGLLQDRGTERLRQNDPVEAARLFDFALQFNRFDADRVAPSLYQALKKAGEAYAQQRKFAEAVATWERALPFASAGGESDFVRQQLTAALIEQGKQFSEAGEYNKALPVFEKAIQTGKVDASVHASRAVAREKTGDLQGAAADYLEASRLAGNDQASAFRQRAGELQLLAAQSQLQEGRFTEALEELNRARANLPESSGAAATTLMEKALQGRAKDQLSNNRLQEALKDYERLAETSGDVYAVEYANALIQAGNQAARQGETRRAREYFEQAEQKSKRRSEDVLRQLAKAYLLLNDPDRHKDLLMQADLAAKGIDETLLSDADKALQAGQFDRAVELFVQISRQTSNITDEMRGKLAQAYQGLGESQLKSGQYDKALESFTEAAQSSPSLQPQLTPQFAQAYLNLALAEYQKGNYERSIEFNSRVVELDRANAVAFYNRAVAHAAWGDRDKAIQDYREAADAYAAKGDPKSADESRQQAASLTYQSAAAANDRGDYAEALQILQQSLQLAPQPTDEYRVQLSKALIARGRRHLDDKQFSKAIEDFDQAARQNASNAALAWKLLGDAYLGQDDVAKAAETFALGRTKFPNDRDLQAGLGQALSRRADNENDPARAIAYLEQAIANDPGHASDYKKAGAARYVAQGETYFNQSKFDLAAKSFEAAIQFDGDNKQQYLEKLVPALRRRAADLAEDPKTAELAIGQYEKVLAIAPPKSSTDIREEAAALCERLANAANKTKDFNSALNFIDRAIQFGPTALDKFKATKAVILNTRGINHFVNNNLQAALDDFTTAIQNSSTHEAFYRKNRALTYAALAKRAGASAKGDLREKAMDDYSRMIELNPPQPNLKWDAYWGRAELRYSVLEELLAKGELSSADLARFNQQRQILKDYDEAIKLEPNHAESHRKLAYLLATWPDASLRDGKRAVTLAKRLCEELRERPSHNDLLTLASAHAQAGQFEAALQRMDQAIEIAPEAEKAAMRTLRSERFEKGLGPP